MHQNTLRRSIWKGLGIMCYVIAFHITGLEDNHFWEKMERAQHVVLRNNHECGERTKWKEGKGHCQHATGQLWFSGNTLKKWCKNRKSTLSLYSPMCLDKQWAGRWSPLIPEERWAGWGQLPPFLWLPFLSPQLLSISLSHSLRWYSSFILYTFEISISSQSDYIQVVC